MLRRHINNRDEVMFRIESNPIGWILEITGAIRRAMRLWNGFGKGGNYLGYVSRTTKFSLVRYAERYSESNP